MSVLRMYPAATAGAGLLLALAVPGYFVAPRFTGWLVNTVQLGALLAVPAVLRVARIRDAWTSRYRLIAAIVLGTVLWDVVTSLLGGRDRFSEWPLVYGSALLVFPLLYVLQAALAGLIARRAPRTR